MNNLKRVVPWFGPVSMENMTKVVDKIDALLKEDQEAPITLLLTSAGGSSPLGFSFYDLVRSLRIPINTVGAGFIDSMAVILFLIGERRLIAPHATMLIHEGTRTVERETITRSAGEAYQKEGLLYDDFYAQIVEECTNGKVKSSDLAEMKRRNTVLDPQEMIKLGLAHDLWVPAKSASA